MKAAKLCVEQDQIGERFKSNQDEAFGLIARGD